MHTRVTQTLSPARRVGSRARVIRALGILGGTIVLSASLAAGAGAQGEFTWEGVVRGNPPASQDGVTVSAAGNPFGDWAWYGTDQAAGSANNQFGVDLNCNHTSGGSECGYNDRGQAVSIYSIDPTGTFTLNDGYFKIAPTFYKPDFIFAQAYSTSDRSQSPIFTMGFAPSTSGLSLETFNWAGVNNVQFVPCLYANAGDTSTSGSNCLYPYYYDQGAGEFLTDDLRFNQVPQSTVPEPSELALLGTGLIGLVPMIRRRLS